MCARLLLRTPITYAMSRLACTSTPATGTCRVALLQLTCTADKERNFAVSEGFIRQGKQAGAKVIFLPECFDFVSGSSEETLALAEPLTGPLMTRYRSLANREDVWLSLGGFHTKEESTSTRIFNSHVLINPSGELVAVYNKLHLFDVSVGESVNLQESRTTIGGDRVVSPVPTPAGNLGLAICYDLRFPELSQALRSLGAHVLTYPSAFTVLTGEAHWHLLLRARSLETGCFVVSAAQEGVHNPRRSSYGHSIVIGPCGSILAECTNPGEQILLADLDFGHLTQTRAEQRVHLRRDLFPDFSLMEREDIAEKEFNFGDCLISADRVVFKTKNAFAFLSCSPIMPGHILVCPLDPVSGLRDVTHVQLVGLYALVQKLLPAMAQLWGSCATNISQQDGASAGQAVKHLHIHLLPRKDNDLPYNDYIYEMLEKYSGDEQSTEADNDIVTQALALRKILYA